MSVLHWQTDAMCHCPQWYTTDTNPKLDIALVSHERRVGGKDNIYSVMCTFTNLAVRRVNIVSAKPPFSLLCSLSQSCDFSTYSGFRPFEMSSQQKPVKYRMFHASGYQMGGRHMKKQPRRSWKLNRWVTDDSIGGVEALSCIFWVSRGDRDIKR